MAFKSITDYNNDRYGGMFLLKNDGDYADVVFMYRSINDALVGDTHYIKSDSYSGYVQCLGQRTCPACARNIRVQPKLFIPVYMVETDEVLFWDRSIRFQQQMESDVFSKFENPSEFVFRITRKGVAGDINTRYTIQAVAKNTVKSYSEILSSLNISMPEYYNTICKDWSISDYNNHLSPASTSSPDIDAMPEYKLSPRVSQVSNELPDFDIDSNDSVDDVNF